MSKTLALQGPVLAIIGPSGVGKSTIVNKLAAKGIVHINPTWTTRPRRPDEADNCEHIFVSEAEFDALESKHMFLETVTMFGTPYKYGLPAISFKNQIPPELVILRASLVPLFKKYYPGVVIYQIEDILQSIRPRLLARQAETNEPLGTRLTQYEDELEAGRKLAKRRFSSADTMRAVHEIADAISEDFAT